jgi:hypothetical protein
MTVTREVRAEKRPFNTPPRQMGASGALQGKPSAAQLTSGYGLKATSQLPIAMSGFEGKAAVQRTWS